jgi:hypothetical protein
MGDHAVMTPRAAPAATVLPTFVLLFAVTPAAAAERPGPPSGLQPIPDEIAAAYRERVEGRQQRLLGEPYLQARRLERRSVGRLALPQAEGAPAFADIRRVVHKSGAALWEVWLSAPAQPMAVERWTGWLDMDAPESLARRVWQEISPPLGGAAAAPEMVLPLLVLRYPDGSLSELLEAHAHDLVKLLHLDPSPQRFKARFVEDELAGDFCRREQGLSLMARNGAIDVHARDDVEPLVDDTPLPRNTLPLLITLEMLCLERAVLRSFLDRFAGGVVGTIDDLVTLRRDIFDGLEEYYGTLAKTHGYTAEATSRGEVLFGIDDLFDSVVDRLESLTFEITTRNQQTVNRLGFWLTTSFGAIETGFVAASIATWYYATELGAVLAWTIGVTLATALGIAALLRGITKR